MPNHIQNPNIIETITRLSEIIKADNEYLKKEMISFLSFADFNISDVFDEDMFNADFSNPNDGISIDDIVDPDSFEELEEK